MGRMYTLRLAPTLLDEAEMEPRPAAAPTTRLGDWDVVPVHAGSRALLVALSDRTDLTIVLPRPDLGDLPEALGIALVPVLRSLGLDDELIGAELDEMTTGLFGAATKKGRLTRAQAQARRAAEWIAAAGPAVDVAALHAMLYAQRASGRDGVTIADRTRAAFDTQHARQQ